MMPDETIPLVARLFRVLVILFDEALTAAGGSGDIIIGALVALLIYRYSAIAGWGGSGSRASTEAASSEAPGLPGSSSSSSSSSPSSTPPEPTPVPRRPAPPAPPGTVGYQRSNQQADGGDGLRGVVLRPPALSPSVQVHTARVVPPPASSTGKRYYVLLSSARGVPGIYPGWTHFRNNVTAPLPGEFYGYPTWEEAANCFLTSRGDEWTVPTFF